MTSNILPAKYYTSLCTTVWKPFPILLVWATQNYIPLPQLHQLHKNPSFKNSRMTKHFLTEGSYNIPVGCISPGYDVPLRILWFSRTILFIWQNKTYKRLISNPFHITITFLASPLQHFWHSTYTLLLQCALCLQLGAWQCQLFITWSYKWQELCDFTWINQSRWWNLQQPTF
jgi:hypothetical protein